MVGNFRDESRAIASWRTYTSSLCSVRRSFRG